MSILSYYSQFVKPVFITIPTPMPVIIKCMPSMWWWPGIGNGIVLTDIKDSIVISFCTEESYVIRPNEAEMQMRMVEILSGGVYNYLKRSGLLKEVQCEIEKKFGWEELELDDCFGGLAEKKDFS